jgi:hypothetical protein
MDETKLQRGRSGVSLGLRPMASATTRAEAPGRGPALRVIAYTKNAVTPVRGPISGLTHERVFFPD